MKDRKSIANINEKIGDGKLGFTRQAKHIIIKEKLRGWENIIQQQTED